jgi:hypothetical protein
MTMTIKPKTSKAPPAATGINPKLIALAAKIDEAKAYNDSLYANDQEDPADDLARAADSKTLKLEKRLAKIAAANLEELKVKARYVYTDSGGAESDTGIAKSIVCDVLALDGKPVSKASWLRRTA